MTETKKPRLFGELAQAFEELTRWKEGKITLKTYRVEPLSSDTGEMPAAALEATMERLDDLDLAKIVKERESEPSVQVTLDEL